jgi:pyruvyl transferase EpsO
VLDLRSVLREHLGPASECALLIYRNNPNVGDAAIWLAATRTLSDLGFSIRYSATRDQANLEELRATLPEGPIFISGGGSLGTNYPTTHAHKESVIKAFPDRKVVILPQSGRFDDDAAFERFGSVVASHDDVTILCRDSSTLDTLSQLDVVTALCPDLVTALGTHSTFVKGRD